MINSWKLMEIRVKNNNVSYNIYGSSGIRVKIHPSKHC